MIKKEESSNNKIGNLDNGFGITSVNLGIVSIFLSFLIPFFGLVLSPIAFFFAMKQNKIEKNSWSKSGIILGVLGFLIALGFTFYVFKSLPTK